MGVDILNAGIKDLLVFDEQVNLYTVAPPASSITDGVITGLPTNLHIFASTEDQENYIPLSILEITGLWDAPTSPTPFWLE